MTNELSSNPFSEEETRALGEKMAAWTETLAPREQQYLVAQLSRLTAQEGSDDTSGHGWVKDWVDRQVAFAYGANLVNAMSKPPSSGAGPAGSGGQGGAGPAPA